MLEEPRTHSVAVIGAGYVGLTTAACLAHLGHRVSCNDIDHAKIERLRRREQDIDEPDLDEFLAAHGAANLSFHTDLGSATRGAEAVFLCLPTPGSSDGSTDLRGIISLARRLRFLLAPASIVVIKSTVPPGTARQLAAIVGPDIPVVSNPEFLREGSAVRDFLHPDRIVIGSACPEVAHRVTKLYDGIDTPVLHTEPTSAEMMKHAANLFLAVKLSYANMLADLCDHLGANITEVLRGLGHDPRIGSSYLHPGPGWGGPCLPKDVRALATLENTLACDLPLVTAVLQANADHQRHVVSLLEQCVGHPVSECRIAVLGLVFKAGTHDVRDSPALAMSAMITDLHGDITAYDPAITEPDPRLTDHLALVFDAETALDGCDCALVLTDWPEFVEIPWKEVATRMRGNTILDTRDCLDSATLAQAGLRHFRLGHPESVSCATAPVAH